MTDADFLISFKAWIKDQVTTAEPTPAPEPAPTPAPTPTPVVNDGSANAPTGTPQFPKLLDGYVKRPSWKVAAVDYRVGPPEGQIYKDPKTLSSLSYDPNTHLWWVLTNNLIVDGYDFSPYPGTIYCYQSGKSDNFTLRNCNMGSCEVSSRANNITVENCIFDGIKGSSIFTNLYNSGPSAIKIQYNILRNFYQHAVELQGVVSSFLYAYNLIQDGGKDPGGLSHLNVLQNQTTIPDSKVLFNTIVQNYTPSHGELLQLYTTGNSNTVEVGNNVLISRKGPNGEASVSTMVNNAQTIQGHTTQNIHDNYFDPTGVLSTIFSITKSDSFNTISNFANNYRLTDGTLITGTGK